MRWTTAGISALLLALGILVLGTRWDGIEVAPGVWRDSVTLQRWSAFWIALAVAGVALAGRLGSWSDRIFAVVPVLLWMAWSLRHGSIWPVAFVTYAVPTVLVWLTAVVLTFRVRRTPSMG